jgi:hypothetical protein
VHVTAIVDGRVVLYWPLASLVNVHSFDTKAAL